MRNLRVNADRIAADLAALAAITTTLRSLVSGDSKPVT